MLMLFEVALVLMCVRLLLIHWLLQLADFDYFLDYLDEVNDCVFFRNLLPCSLGAYSFLQYDFNMMALNN